MPWTTTLTLVAVLFCIIVEENSEKKRGLILVFRDTAIP